MNNCIVFALVSIVGSLVLAGIVWLVYQYFKSLSIRRWVKDYVAPLLLLIVIGFFVYFSASYFLNLQNKDDEILSFIGTICAIVLGLQVYRIQNRILISQIVERVSGELEEIHRHLRANKRVLDKLNKEKVPSLSHIRKFAITKYSALSDDVLLRNLDKTHNKIIFPMTVRVRNYNISVSTMEEYLKSGSCEKDIFEKYVNNMINITNKLCDNIEKCVSDLDIKFHELDMGSDLVQIVYTKETW